MFLSIFNNPGIVKLGRINYICKHEMAPSASP